MKPAEIIQLRLQNQQLIATNFKKPGQIVSWMVAMQAQEYAMAKWAVGLRLKDTTDTEVEKAFNEGAILRTHVMRPTWHFVSPADIKWLLCLTAPRVHALNAHMYRQTELDEKLLKRAADIMMLELQGGKFRERTQLQLALQRRKIVASSMRLAYLIMYAELEGLICSGPRVGKQFTYALLQERAPHARELSREEALVEFAERYFSSRGPATVKDFAYWSGLPPGDARIGVAELPRTFMKKKIGGAEYIWRVSKVTSPAKTTASFLMPDYDEYGMSYADRGILMSERVEKPVIQYNRMLVIDGKIEGTWKRSTNKKEVTVELVPFADLPTTKHKKATAAINQFTRFVK